MRILNIANPKNTQIEFEISKFPDGQQQVTINERSLYVGEYKTINSVVIKTRLNNFMDVELLCCAVASLRACGISGIHLYSPYFLGSRSDRQFSSTSNNYLKTVICPIINSLKFESVEVLDPHSDVLEMGLNNFKKTDNIALVKYALTVLYGTDNDINDKFILISPDGGALKKMYQIPQRINYVGPVFTCTKVRAENGQLTHTSVLLTGKLPQKDFIIVDDIIDGGKTFINIAQEIQRIYKEDKGNHIPKIYLIVTHGIFSNGFSELEKLFSGIFTTNSYANHTEAQFTKTILKQLNVF